MTKATSASASISSSENPLSDTAIASDTFAARSSSEKERRMVGERVPSPETKAMPSRMMNATESSRAVLPRTLRVTVLKNVFFMGNPGRGKICFLIIPLCGQKEKNLCSFFLLQLYKRFKNAAKFENSAKKSEHPLTFLRKKSILL